jgi:hypothetical protein
LALSLPEAQAAISTVSFAYTGSAQTWTVPAGVSTVRVEAYGAQGGGDYGGFGAGVVTSVTVTPGQQLTVRVGGRGAQAAGGFNGGGGSSFAGAGLGQGQGGGGASDVSLGDTRLVVAGGGGGAAGGPDFGMGGSAGGISGEAGVDGSGVHRGGGGGTSAEAGAGGGAYAGSGNGAVGGNGGFNAGGGGGGWLGGGGGGGDSSGGSAAGGGAGSSYAQGTATFVQGARTGDGEVDISWGGTPAASAGQAKTFTFTGGPQLYQVPTGVTSLAVRAVGAQGGTGTSRAGFGADVSARVAVTPNQVLAVLVGGRGGNGDGCGALSCGEPQAGNSVGGFNGGGTNTFAGAGTGRGTGGGGATDLRRGSWRLEKRVVVAGGGGGSSVNGSGVQPGLGQGGDASGPIGGDGVAGDGQYAGGKGGTQEAGGQGGGAYAGAGGSANGGSGGFFGGSGGGGWFGGGGGGGDSSGGSPGGGGAGSSHVTDPIGEPTYAPNPFGGDGQLGITVAGTETPTDPGPTPTTPSPSPTAAGPATYVALGDSYASGEGATRFQTGTSFADPDHPGATIGCHRSDTSWAYGVYDVLKKQKKVQDIDFVACSGAVFDRLYGRNDQFKKVNEIEPPQLDAVKQHNTVVATLSMGGNDVGFEPVLQACVSYPRSPGGFGCSRPGTEAYNTAKAGMDALRTQVDTPSSTVSAKTPLPQVYMQIVEQMAAGGTLYVTGYPHLFAGAKRNYPREVVVVGGRPRVINACRVGTAGGIAPIRISYEDAFWINQLVDAGDAVINQAVTAANQSLQAKGGAGRVVFVDVRSQQFDQHAICSGDKWFNGVQLSRPNPLPAPMRTSFHPNARGQQEYERILDAVLNGGQ